MSMLCCAKPLQSCLTLETPWTVARQDPLSMGFSRQEYWSGLQFLPPRKSVSIATPISLSTSVSMFTPISMRVRMRCHFSHVLLFVTLWTVAHQAPLWDSPGKNTGVGFHDLLQGILLTLVLISISHVSCIGRWVFYH